MKVYTCATTYLAKYERVVCRFLKGDGECLGFSMANSIQSFHRASPAVGYRTRNPWATHRYATRFSGEVSLIQPKAKPNYPFARWMLREECMRSLPRVVVDSLIHQHHHHLGLPSFPHMQYCIPWPSSLASFFRLDAFETILTELLTGKHEDFFYFFLNHGGLLTFFFLYFLWWKFVVSSKKWLCTKFELFFKFYRAVMLESIHRPIVRLSLLQKARQFSFHSFVLCAVYNITHWTSISKLL